MLVQVGHGLRIPSSLKPFWRSGILIYMLVEGGWLKYLFASVLNSQRKTFPLLSARIKEHVFIVSLGMMGRGVKGCICLLNPGFCIAHVHGY